uniref:Nuclear speckle splicing regulatory protein 1 n=1 Tax=Anthurium amnicola TaxID=1678845 RepID=A0A1D1Y2W4_9ARAE
MRGYGLQLRKKPAATRPTLPPPAPGFGADDDEDDVERDIARQAAVNRGKKEIEAMQKKALEEDSSIFDYDGAYDKFKVETVRPLMQDREERKSKYIHTLMEKAKEREREHEIIYERKLLKERSKDDHLYAGKEKFVTSAYKKKLAEDERWKEEERLRIQREEKEDVTKKNDMSDFYFNLNKNVAFGARGSEYRKASRLDTAAECPANERSVEREDVQQSKEHISPSASAFEEEREIASGRQSIPNAPEPMLEPAALGTASAPEKAKTEQAASQGQQTGERYKRSEDAVAAAKERYLARKRVRQE